MYTNVWLTKPPYVRPSTDDSDVAALAGWKSTVYYVRKYRSLCSPSCRNPRAAILLPSSLFLSRLGRRSLALHFMARRRSTNQEAVPGRPSDRAALWIIETVASARAWRRNRSTCRQLRCMKQVPARFFAHHRHGAHVASRACQWRRDDMWRQTPRDVAVVTSASRPDAIIVAFLIPNPHQTSVNPAESRRSTCTESRTK